jgi:predicted nucleotide-binding protein
LLICGADEGMNQKVVSTLKQLGLEMITFDGKETQVKSFASQLAQCPEIDFAVVLLSVDGYAYLKDQKPQDAKLITHQGFIFKLGYLIGRLGRDRVFILYHEKKNFELPSGFFEAYYIPYDPDRRWHTDLIRTLQTHGYPLDPQKLKRL